MIDREERVAKARELYLSGYNCAQAVFTAFADLTGMDERTALRLSGGMGGGMGGLRGICGGLSGMFLVMGLLRGYDQAGDMEGKKRLYAAEQGLAARFQERFEATHCKRLLEMSQIAVSNMPAERTPEYYKKRPCARYIEWCAGTLADELNKDGE